MTKAALRDRPFDMWRYEEILPVQDPAVIPKLGEGGTPLHQVPRLGGDCGFRHLLVKEEGLNPTASFKARGLAMAVARAKELGATTLAIPSAGNAASAMAAYAARAGLEAIVAMPRDTPMMMQAECSAYGAKLLLVDGLINDAGAVIRAGAAELGWFDVSTLQRALPRRGQKDDGPRAGRAAWLAAARRDRLPDRRRHRHRRDVEGVRRARDDGLDRPERPKMFVVQAEGCAPIVRAFQRGERFAELWEDATTSAPGLRVPVAIGDYLILDAVRASGGTAVTVTETEIKRGMELAAKCEGLFVSPESGAAVIAAKNLRANELLGIDDETVVFSTGAGIKHIDMIGVDAPILDPRAPDLLSQIERAIGN